MAWVFLVALLVCIGGIYAAFWLVDRRIGRDWVEMAIQKPVGGKVEHVLLYDVRTQEAVATLDISLPVTTRPVPYDWEVAGDFE